MNNQDLLTKLREAIPSAQNGQKELLKEVGLALKGYGERVTELESTAARLHANNRNLQAAMEEAPLPDAPGSINFKMADPACKVVGQFTFRFHTPELAIERFPALVQKLLEAGLVSEDEYIDQRRTARAEVAPLPQPVVTSKGANLPPVANGLPVANHSREELSFEAKSLEGERKKGKNYWKVKGGKYARFGVTIWEEALTAAGFDFESLNPDEVYNLSGYTAHYEMDEEGKNPKKVTRLERN